LKERSFILLAIGALLYFATEDAHEGIGKGDSLGQIGVDLSVIATIAGVLV
jgi:glucose uptake protein GlcU